MRHVANALLLSSTSRSQSPALVGPSRLKLCRHSCMKRGYGRILDAPRQPAKQVQCVCENATVCVKYHKVDQTERWLTLLMCDHQMTFGLHRLRRRRPLRYGLKSMWQGVFRSNPTGHRAGKVAISWRIHMTSEVVVYDHIIVSGLDWYGIRDICSWLCEVIIITVSYLMTRDTHHIHLSL